MREGQASRTAEYVALFRALESSLPARERLFEDPLAHRFLGPRLAWVATLGRVPGAARLLSRFIDRRWAGARSSAVARTRLIDDEIEQALTRGLEQLVILGAGFDSRAYRMEGLSTVTVFEVDHPDTLAKRRRVIERASLGSRRTVRPVGIDFKTGDLDRSMSDAGYSKQARSFILWEGVTSYLTEAAVDATLRWCAEAASGSELLFTYLHRAVVDDPQSFPGTDRILAALEAAGERWTFGLDPLTLDDFLRQRGLALERDIGCDAYRARYMPELSRSLRGYEFYRIAIARVAGSELRVVP